MSLKQQLTEDMKAAMKAKDTVKLGVIRFLKSEIRNVEIDNGEQDDQGVLKIIARQAKQMKDAIEEYKKGDRQDLVADEEKKVAILEAYLPQQMSDDELKQTIQQVIKKLGDQVQMGQVMKAVMAEVNGKADGKRVSQMVKQAL